MFVHVEFRIIHSFLLLAQFNSLESREATDHERDLYDKWRWMELKIGVHDYEKTIRPMVLVFEGRFNDPRVQLMNQNSQ